MPAWSYVRLGLVLVTSPCHSLLEHDVLAPLPRLQPCISQPPRTGATASHWGDIVQPATLQLAAFVIVALQFAATLLQLATLQLVRNGLGRLQTSWTTSIQTLQKVRATQDMQYGFPPLR